MATREPSDSQPDDLKDFDRGALSALLREINATHFFVWSVNAGGALYSTKIPVSDIAQQVNGANRTLSINLDEARNLLQTASKQFDNTAHRWESQARQSEQQLRASASPGKLNEAKAKHNAVRIRINPVQNLFRRAGQSLDNLHLKRQLEERRAQEGQGTDNSQPEA